MARLTSVSGDLARRGFQDPQRAEGLIEELESCGFDPGWDWMAAFEPAADPDLALDGITQLVAAGYRPALTADEETYRRSVLVLGGSHALHQHLIRVPDDLSTIREADDPWTRDRIVADVLAAVGADSPGALASAEDASDRLRLINRRHLVRIAARDLGSVEPEHILESVAAELADLADAVMSGALAIARTETPGHEDIRLGIVALGKCGARELNYISDIDVLFVAEPAHEGVAPERVTTIGTKLAAAVTRICSAHTAAGSIWQVDAALRPEGKAGPLVRTIASMRTYYEKWASNWEFQAMLKARPMAGDLALAQEFCDLVAPMVWQAGERPDFIAESQAMRKRVVSLIPPKEAEREIKLGSGGLRDVEFTVQLLQLVHGRADERLRLQATLPSLRALTDSGYIGRTDGLQLATAYRFQRTLEHRIQLFRLRRTHLMPDYPADIRRLARSLGVRPAEDVVDQWRASARRVQRLHQRVFYSPLLEAVARIPAEDLRLTPEAAHTRLKALGFLDSAAALRHIEALTQGRTRSVEIQRQLMPAMLGWFAEGPNPDAALLAFRQVSDALGGTPWYLRALRDEGPSAHRLAQVLSSSRYCIDLVKSAPETVQMIVDQDHLTPVSRDTLTQAMVRAAERHDTPDQAIAAVRAYRRRELFRIAVGDICGVVGFDEVGPALTDLASATIEAALSVATRGVEQPPSLGVVAMGRWGGREMSYGSDADAMFVMADSDDPEALRKAGQIVSRVRSLLAAPGPDPALEIDIDLRPEGKGGPMVRSLSSYLAYYGKWSSTWESQALLRASYGAGDAETVARLLAEIDRLRYPPGGLSRSQLVEIRRLKARVDTERIPRGSDPKSNLKLGPGGLSDVEWTVQLLQLQHGAEHQELRTTQTLPALRAATGLGLIDATDSSALSDSWRQASVLRNAIMLVRGRPSDQIPSDANDQGAVAHLLGYPLGHASQLRDDRQRVARRAAQVVDRVFWGE